MAEKNVQNRLVSCLSYSTVEYHFVPVSQKVAEHNPGKRGTVARYKTCQNSKFLFEKFRKIGLDLELSTSVIQVGAKACQSCKNCL